MSLTHDVKSFALNLGADLMRLSRGSQVPLNFYHPRTALPQMESMMNEEFGIL
jgi:hypothetical protein